MSDTIVFEIGTEELPALELHKATKQIEDIVCGQAGKLFNFDNVNVYSTPRRFIVCITGASRVIEAKTEEFKGPKIEIAFQDDKPTKAAIGFAKGKGVEVDELIIKDGCVFAIKKTEETKVADLLPNLFLDLIKSISWKKTQRWGSFNEEFARPIRWIVAMFGSDIIDLEYAGLKSSNITYGHRFLCPGPKQLNDADELLNILQDNKVVLTESSREELIRKQVKEIEKKESLVASLPDSIMQEVVNLCEYPTCMVGSFDKNFLEVPKEIIVDAMLVHQRYFPLFTNSGDLTNKFIIVSNGDSNFSESIIDGNQRVVAARLYDAKFFFEEDKKRPLESYIDKLEQVVFQEQLGTMKEKAQRLVELASFISDGAQLSDQEKQYSKRSALLCKCDLVTSAVVEFTQVQGIMGYYYANASDEDNQVACAIKQHYQPKFSGDNLPDSKIAKCVALADKIDTLCGMFAVNQAPTGSSDPFALRRGSIGIISIMMDDFDFSLVDTINFSLNLYNKQGIDFDKDNVLNTIIDFVIARTKVILKDMGIEHDTIEAVSSVDVKEPLDFIARAKALNNARLQKADVFDDLATAFTRANNLRDHKLGDNIDKSLFNNYEKLLFEAINNTKFNINEFLSKQDYANVLEELSKLKNPIDNFFEGVMIMDEDKSLRENRLKLLNAFVSVFVNVADFSKMAKSK